MTLDPETNIFNRNRNFRGGAKAYYKFLKKNLKWPSQNKTIQGKVFISFVIEKDGHLTNFKVEKKLSPDFDKEALRVLKRSPRWKPVIRNGKPEKCRYTVPINFRWASE